MYISTDKALRAADGFRRPLRSLTRKNRTKRVPYETGRAVHEFTCKLVTCNCQELHAPGYQPGLRMLCEIERTERKRTARYLRLELNAKKEASRTTPKLLVSACIFL